MYSFTTADAGASEDVWIWISAAQEVRAAIDAVEEVAAAFSALLHDTHWNAEGVRALRALLHSLLAASKGEVADLHARSAEIDTVMAS